ncbi:MAG: hypothetical protein JJ953_09385 [Gracilimonas sp.]|uniref:hypothetical protein n=1 Tax=Gracilimonas sp. TaxID=1974203 RepID=UPI001B1BECED|nr:hypothetical protein [Gracilimonas sp.]MBO6586303.1 hypothetical protein [Gracilimonas sp.]MBO6614960.1 hypothetical protein [Gracilimonas sp.]
MDNFLDKEYHPVIEDFITDYVDGEMGSVERATFEEVLVHDDDLRELAFSAKEGKKLLSQFREVKAGDGFMEKLIKKIS